MRLNRSTLSILFSLLVFNSQAQITRQATWQQTVNYSIEVSLDDKNHILRGFETMEYINNSPNTLEEIYIHLWPNAYKNDQTSFAKQMMENGETSFYFSKDNDRGYIDSIDFFINGKGTTWGFDITHQDIAKITLNNPLKPGDKCLISTPFLVKIPTVFSRMGHDGQTYSISQWYPKPAVYDINGWNPIPYLNQGEFYSEFGSFDVKITLPKNYIVAATGVLQDSSEISFRNDKGKNTGVIENTYCKTPFKTVQFKQDNIHDFAWFASKNFGILKSSVEIGGKTIETFVYSQKNSDLINNNTDAIKTALTYYSENAGNYPYSHASVVKSELKAGGGMEYPMITVCDILNQEVIIHEVGHNWFYGILGSNERRYPWMDESINSYFETDAMKPTLLSKQTNKRQNFINNATDFSMDVLAMNAIRLNTAQAVGLHSADFTDLNYGIMVYGKGALIFKHLRAFLGDEMFKKCFNTYFETWKYKHPLPGDMQKVFEEVSGQKLEWFFHDLINENKKLDIKIISAKINNDGVVKINISNKGYKGMPVPIGIYNGKTLLETVWVSENKTIPNTQINPKQVTHFLIDPNTVTMDANRKNNEYKMKGLIKRWPNPSIKLFTLPDNKVSRQMFILPAIGGNIHNGLMLGAGFHNWSVPLRKFEYMVMPLWSFKTKTLSGYANFNYKITPKKMFQSVDVGVNNATFAYVPLSEPYTYYRSKGYINSQLKPKNLRCTKRSYINLEYTNVAARWLEKSSKTADSNQAKPYFASNKAPIDYGFARITYLHENKKVINPYSFKFSLERGGYKGELNYWKPEAEINYLKTYTKKGRGFSVRLFAGTFITQSNSDLGLFQYRLGSKNGQYNYGMEQSLMGRGANTGLWSSNITTGEDNMKLKGTLGNFSKGFLIANLSSNLPGKIPFRPYADLCLMQKGNLVDQNSNKANFIYSGGLAIDIIPKMLIIYLPLIQSKAIEISQGNQKINTFGQRICFTLALNEFEPHKLFKQIKLF